MKAKHYIYLFAGLLVFLLTSLDVHNEKKFYYAFANKVYLTPQNNKILVKFTEGFDKSKTEQYLKTSESGIQVTWRASRVAEITAGLSKSLENLLKTLELQEDISSCQTFYKTEDGLEIGITDEILVRFQPGVSEKQQQEVKDRFGTKVLKTTEIYQKLVIPKGADVFEIANRYYESGLTEFSTPNFF